MKTYPFQHRHPTTGVTSSSEGMDLRDYFAGLAMQVRLTTKENYWTLTEITNQAYMDADAMLKAREPKDEQS
jgi:hypothetical protein